MLLYTDPIFVGNLFVKLIYLISGNGGIVVDNGFVIIRADIYDYSASECISGIRINGGQLICKYNRNKFI